MNEYIIQRQNIVNTISTNKKHTDVKDYFEQYAAYNVYLQGPTQPVGYCSSILIKKTNDTLTFRCMSIDNGYDFEVPIYDYLDGKAKIVKLVPETSEDISLSYIASDKYDDDLSHYTDIHGNITSDECIKN